MSRMEEGSVALPPHQNREEEEDMAAATSFISSQSPPRQLSSDPPSDTTMPDPSLQDSDPVPPASLVENNERQSPQQGLQLTINSTITATITADPQASDFQMEQLTKSVHIWRRQFLVQYIIFSYFVTGTRNQHMAHVLGFIPSRPSISSSTSISTRPTM